MASKQLDNSSASRPKKSSRSSVSEKETLDATNLNAGKMSLSDYAQLTKEELIKLGDKINEATDKGMNLAHEIAEDVHKFTKNATELTRLKIDLHNLKEERDNLFALMGEQLRNLYRTDKLSRIKSRMKADFIRLDELEALIKEKEKLISRISL